MYEERRRDAGMTLPEVLISIVVMGMLGVVLLGTVQVAIGSQRAARGRVGTAADEQSLALNLPNDLASAATVDTEPGMAVCPGSCDPAPSLAGSNALLLTWTLGGTPGAPAGWVRVGYVFGESVDDPGSYQLNRIECRSSDNVAWTCEERVVLRGLAGPPGGALFQPGVTVPSWVLQVSAPLAADAIEGGKIATGAETKGANRVVVTVNGGGFMVQAQNTSNQISITAGGTTRSQLAPEDVFNAPSFTSARSRCGGPITLIVDDSGSIGSAMSTVRLGVESFIDSFAGTPTQLQIVRFDTRAGVLGAGTGWSHYYDLSVEAEVASLKAELPQLVAGGGTNWEDAWFRAVYNADGSPQDITPEMIVFFTDGKQTYERLRVRADPGEIVPDRPPLPGPGWPTWSGYYSNGYSYTQVGFNRTDWIVDQFRSSVRMIGVGVGDITTTTVGWIDNPGAGFHLEYERGYRAFQQLVSGSWVWIAQADFDAGNTTADDSDGFRPVAKEYVTTDSAAKDWEPTTEQRTDGGYRSIKTYSEPFDDYDPAVTTTTSGLVVLSRLIAGHDNAVQANWNPDEQRYDNAETAELYTLDNYDKFAEALRAVALAECGGTLSVTTRVDGGVRAPVEFEFQNTDATAGGAALALEPTVVVVNPNFPVGTFDFNVPGAQTLVVDVLPGATTDMANYRPAAEPWTCKVGSQQRPYTAVPISGSDWVGARVEVGANEAVSCTLEVTPR